MFNTLHAERSSLLPPGAATLIILPLLLILCYYPVLLMTGRVVVLSEDMAHGFFAPIVAAYVAWTYRSAILHPLGSPSVWSVGFVGIGACLGTIATLASSSTFSRLGFLLSLAGCLLLIGGCQTLFRFIFPLGLLLFTFPIPDVLYGQMTQPLQLLATRLSESCLEMLGFSVIREGNVLQLTHMSLSVVEACSGLRSLITLVFFCLVYGYFFESRFWLRTGIVLLAIPSAIAINALRITATGVLGKYSPMWTEGTYHEIVGWAAFALGFIIVMAGHQTVRRALHPSAPGLAQ